jgi:hypothetical protein
MHLVTSEFDAHGDLHHFEVSERDTLGGQRDWGFLPVETIKDKVKI